MATAVAQDNIWNDAVTLNNPHIQDNKEVKTLVNSHFRTAKGSKDAWWFLLLLPQETGQCFDPKCSNLKQN